jgi:alpha-glucosidase
LRANSAAWWRRGVIYQVYPRSFQDSDGDGVGDLPGITARLDYLAWLGVDAVWLSPFFPSPGADFGYDVSDYVDVDPLFGTLADFDRLLARAHQLGLKVVIDFVPNHTSDQHPWFRESRSSRDNPKRDWYTWRDPKPDGSPPNNWLAVFGGPSWTFDKTTGQSYMHSFLPQQPDLNWRNPDVKAAMFDVIRFWLDRGVDGFRVDVAHYVMKDPELRDNPPNPDYVPGGVSGSHKSLGEHESQLHVHDRNHPDIHPLFREIRALFDSYGERAIIGEIHMWNLPEWATFYGAQLDELHLPFNFGLLKTRWQVRALREHIAGIEEVVPEGGWPNYVLGNHDEGRIATRLGPEHARTAMLLLLTLRGTPTLYYGDELGMENVAIPPERERDPWGLRVPGLGLSRDPARTPMQWDPGPNAGFTNPDAVPWLPLEACARERNVATQRENPRSMLSLTRRLLELRRAHDALSTGSYVALDGLPEQVLGYERSAGAERFAVLLNLGDRVEPVRLPAPARLEVTTEMDGGPHVEGGTITLRPHEGVIVRIQS